MTKNRQTGSENHRRRETSNETDQSARQGQRVPWWQAVLLPLVSVLLFFLLLEGGLALFGVRPAIQSADPFVGFASNVDLFVPVTSDATGEQLATASNKHTYFNQQSFTREKPPETFRIFCLGGSTTYGRPYDDRTSFAGWLRELLPNTDRSKNWEVINAGGISYASYRISHLMEELVDYQPDMFIVYTGHNEFLEERTYREIKQVPSLVRTTVSLLAKTRTWTAVNAALQRVGIQAQEETEPPNQLRAEVNAILDRSAGLNRYSRDDQMQENVLQHYQISLERMVALARSVDARIIFVTPAANLKDCSPFKSEHTSGMSAPLQAESAQSLIEAKTLLRQEKWQDALALLEQALAIDPRHAELHYRRGQSLLRLGHFKEAEQAFQRARDEDVCPLRALTQMRQIVLDLAAQEQVEVVDYVDLLNRHMEKLRGYPIPGEELFLDHVHPTIEGNRLLAVALARTMADQGLVQLSPNWDDDVVPAVAAKIEGQVDRRMQGQALANLARVLLWAGKVEDAERLAGQALSKASDVPKIALDANVILVKAYQKQNQPDRALSMLYSALEDSPSSVELRYILGTALVEEGPSMQLEAAAANLLLVCEELSYDDAAFQYFALAMAKRGRMDIAYGGLRQALRINPQNRAVKKALEQFPDVGANQSYQEHMPQTRLDFYPDSAPRKLEQVRVDARGLTVPDGIVAEFYPNGRIKSFLDVERGVPNGVEIYWDEDGRLLSKKIYRKGLPVN